MRVGSDSIVNAAVVMMCVATTYAVLHRFVVPTLSRLPTPATYQPGEQIGDSLGDLPLARSRTTVVIYASSRCGYCSDSVPFYRHLLSLRSPDSEGTFQIVVVSAQGLADARAFVETHQLDVDEVRELPSPRRHRFTGTPALLVLDSTGIIVGIWPGRASGSAEREILSTIGRRVADRSGP